MEAIRKLLQDMKHTVKKTDIMEQLNNTVLALNNEVLPTVNELLTLVSEKNLSMEMLPELSNLNRETFKSKDIKSFVNNIVISIKNLNTISADLISLADKEIPDLLGKDVVTVKQAYLLNVITTITNFTLYTPDIVLYIVNLIDNKVNNKPLSFVKFKLIEIRTDLNRYGNLLVMFKDSKTIIPEINKLSKDRVLVDSKDNGTFNMLSFSKSKLPLVGFIGNPIYHIRMWFVDAEINKYELLKEKKKLTELKILELKARQNNEVDPKLQKAVEYQEEKLAKIEYQIRKTEEI